LTILQTNTQINLDFSLALPAAKYTKLCMVWQPNIRQNAVPPPNPTPLEFSSSEQDDISVEIFVTVTKLFWYHSQNLFCKIVTVTKWLSTQRIFYYLCTIFLRITKALRKFIL